MKRSLKFEAFEGKVLKIGKPEVSIMRSGAIGFSTSFMKKYKLENSRYVGLRFASDEEYFYIGFSFFVDSAASQKRFKIYYPKPNYGVIAAKSFFDSYQITPVQYKRRYPAEVYDDAKFGRMYVIKLPKNRGEEVKQS
jgi:hypothetical protein